MFKFLHAADLHLDSPLKGLQRYEGAPDVHQATRQALMNLVQLALDEKVAFVVIAGDVYDGDWPDHRTGLFFHHQMARLSEAGIPVYLIAGNHDAANKMTRSLRLPDNVHRLSHEEPETVVLESCGAAIHGQGFANQAVLDNLACNYPAAVPGCFNLGLLHTCATGTGEDGHDPYAPCTLDDLRRTRYDYWALGHIHKRSRLLGEPLTIFPGNLQGRHIRESGPKGCSVVTVDDRFQPRERFEPLDVLRWDSCRLGGQQIETGDDLLDRFGDALRNHLVEAEGRPVALRVEVRGPCPAHEQLTSQPQKWLNELRQAATAGGGGLVWIEKLKLSTTLPTRRELPDNGPIGELVQLLEELREDEEALLSLACELSELDRKLPPELREGAEALDIRSPELLREVLEHVQPMLLGRLLQGAQE